MLDGIHKHFFEHSLIPKISWSVKAWRRRAASTDSCTGRASVGSLAMVKSMRSVEVVLGCKMIIPEDQRHTMATPRASTVAEPGFAIRPAPPLAGTGATQENFAERGCSPGRSLSPGHGRGVSVAARSRIPSEPTRSSQCPGPKHHARAEITSVLVRLARFQQLPTGSKAPGRG